MRKLVLILILAAAGAAAGFVFFGQGGGGTAAVYRLAAVERGSIVSSVSSSGTLKALVTVEVGTQVSGQIEELEADYNTKVEKNQVIARIDPETFAAKVRQSEADLSVSKANVAQEMAGVERARADLENARASLDAAGARAETARISAEDAERDILRKRDLFERRVIASAALETSQADFDKARAQLDAAEADRRAQQSQVASRNAQVKMAEAAVVTARAQVEQKQAALHSDELALEHTVIRSPVAGVVVKRDVDVGTTVAASLQAPTLFTIAQDLHEMQVEVSVDEADIGRIREGQKVEFTVDAYLDREFSGRVQQIRLAPKTVQNVVTYTVVVSAQNSELTLLPGMTANVRLIIDERPRVLKLPNAALRFRPKDYTPPEGDRRGAAAARPDGGAHGGGGAPSGGGARGGGRGGGGNTQGMIQDLTRNLDLSADQQERLRASLSGNRERMQAMRQQGLDGEGMRKQLQDITNKAIQSVLTDEQKTKWREQRAEQAVNPVRRTQVFVLDDDGAPKAVQVAVGISDGDVTEVVGGDLEEGQKIIVGTERAASGGGSSSRFRFGF